MTCIMNLAQGRILLAQPGLWWAAAPARGLLAGPRLRVGIPQHVTGLGEVINNPVHATGVGLLLWGRSLEAGPRPSLNAGRAGVAFTRFRNWFRGAF